MAVLLLSSCGISVGEPILTIQSPDGDVIDCLNTMDQPSLKNPLLKNHIFQETPSDHVKREDDGFGLQVWHSEGITCPRGTIPIRRFDKNISHTKYDPLVPNAADRATKGHKYAIAEIKWQPVYGTKASLSVWSPIVEFPADFSLAQIWLVSGQYEENNLNTIEAGWQVYPNRYGDHQPRLFTYWTDVFTGNWWMGMGENIVPIGYWPAEIFTSLSDHATTVQWGGEVYRNTSGRNTTLQMGSGKYPNKGFRQAAYFCNIRIAKENRTLLPIEDFVIGGTQLDSYTIRKSHSKF
ncbi:uncharacterized protein LOC106368313 [Brassica napus]|uniref:uncharacterized protein LOC106368313 n=1 Tax=Brassica napus TaxID=3708 RepID=UPI0020794CE8|nr:uncharacterized protein LOC106368313 [Brassica napus]